MSDQTLQRTGAEEITWDLSDLYSAVDDPTIERDLDDADARADTLAETYRGRIAELDEEEVRDLVDEFEAIYEQAMKAGSYASLHWTTNQQDPARGALLQKITERGARLNQKLLFVELEWANVADDRAKKIMDSPIVARFRHWLEVTRLYRPHLLSEPEEKILTEKSVTGRSAWSRYYSEVLSAARYELDGEKLTQEEVLKRLYEPDRDLRRRAAEAVTAGLAEISRTTTYIFNVVLADKASDDRLRDYPTWITSRNLANEVDDDSVEALIRAITGRYDIVARYYHLKRRLLGLDELTHYDRYAPLPAADRFYSWDEARDIVLNAYGKFDPRMAGVAGQFFEKRWIDANVVPGKRGGAFSASCVPSVHPYILVNYQAKPRDVMTLAHELGHGVHQYLARPQGILQQSTPLTTAETASVFGEMLVFQDLLSRESDPAVRLAMLTSKLEDSFATVFRQISMNRFEDLIHTARRQEGELAAERYNELWMETQRAMFLDSVNLGDGYANWWSYVSHFIAVPGYVYAYAFGELLVLALYARYQEVGAGFSDAYLQMLSAGGSDWPHELVKPLGVDLRDPNFWDRGLDTLDAMVSEAESLAAL